jgi:hypothetical protein
MVLENRKCLSLPAVELRTVQTHCNIPAPFQFKAVGRVKCFGKEGREVLETVLIIYIINTCFKRMTGLSQSIPGY